MKVVAFGTSLTLRGGWPAALRSALEQALGHPVTVVAVARSGASSHWGRDAVDAVIAESADVILIEFATNDAALDRLMSWARSRANLASILTRLRAAPSHPRIFIMTMNPVLGLRGVMRPFLSRFNAAHKALAEDAGVGFIDNRRLWLNLSKNALRKALPDGLHPKPDVTCRLIVPSLVNHIMGVTCND